MAIRTTTHLNFRGDARAALGFYQSVFGGDIVLVTHAQSYGTTDPAEAELIGYGQVTSPAGFSIMAYDVPASREYAPGIAPVFVSVRGDTADEVAGYWAGLVEGGTVIAPFGPSQWSKGYGMLRDRFGVTWVLDVASYPA